MVFTIIESPTSFKPLCGKGFLYTPPASQPRMQSDVGQARFSCPQGQRLLLSVKCKKPVISFIVQLGSSVRPNAVCRRIISIVINPFQFIVRMWSHAHVSKETIKRMEPPVAHCNSATTVMIVRNVRNIGAPSYHSKPNIIFGQMGIAVGAVRRTTNLTPKTATTAGFTSPKKGGQLDNDGSANALTLPNGCLISRAHVPQNRQSAKAQAGQIYDFGIKNWLILSDRIRCSHEVFSLSENGLVRLVRKAQTFWRAVCILTQTGGVAYVF